MHDDLTAQDIAMMQKELDHRKLELMPELIEEVKRTRAFGDLSENFEYKAAKQAQNRNRSRIRYLERMIKSAHVIEDKAGADEVGLFDKVELLFEDDEDTETVQVVTTVRCDPLSGRISCKAPLGKALLGRKAGDEVSVTTEEGGSYTVRIKSITKEDDNGDGPILYAVRRFFREKEGIRCQWRVLSPLPFSFAYRILTAFRCRGSEPTTTSRFSSSRTK